MLVADGTAAVRRRALLAAAAAAGAAATVTACGSQHPLPHRGRSGVTHRRTLTTRAPRMPRGGCFRDPGACGFPDPQAGTVGAGDCSRLPAWSPSDLPAHSYSLHGNTVVITAANVTITGRNIGDWQLYADGAAGFTLDRDCVGYDGHGAGSSTAVWSTGPRLTVRNSTLIAPGCTAAPTAPCTSGGVDEALISGGAQSTVEGDVLAGAIEPVNGLGPGSVVRDSYIVANGVEPGAHSEAVYEADIHGITIDHNTLLNPMDQSGVVYADSPTRNGQPQPCQNRLSVTGNLLAGGGYVLVACPQASGPGTSSLRFVGNVIAACRGGDRFDAALGGRYCAGAAPTATAGTAIGAGADARGFWPRGGFFGLTEGVYCPPTPGVVWSANVWDGTGATVPCA